MIERRGFLKIATTLMGGAMLATYTEPLIKLATPESHKWIEDKGDFYIVRVPMYKSFTKEHLDRPTIFLMDNYSIVSDVTVIGYSNFKTQGSRIISNCCFDITNTKTVNERSAVLFYNKYTDDVITGLNVYGKRATPVTHPTNIAANDFVHANLSLLMIT